MSSMNIAVIFGGLSAERAVSISGAKSVVKALRSLGHNVTPIDPAFGAEIEKGEQQIASDVDLIAPDVLEHLQPKVMIDCVNHPVFDSIETAFINLHGTFGEDGRIQSLLELRGVKYTGSGVKASSLSIDKNASKMLFAAAGLPTPPWATIMPEDHDNLELFAMLRKELGNKLVVKPNKQGSAIGVHIILDGDIDKIHNAVKDAAQFSNLIIVEQYIEGRELTVSVLGDAALPVIEIIPHEGFYDYTNKYTSGRTEYICPAEISEDITDFAQSISLSAYMALGCQGCGRADIRMNEDGALFLLEMNTLPGMTSTSLVPKAAREVGIEFPELCQQIIDFASIDGE